ncbi:MAG: HD domain-containing phosphohydrolase [Pseudomonadota bacterium]
MKILVVDDDVELLKMLGTGLRIKGYQALKALSGEEALKHLNDSANKVDLVLTDYAMPGMHGIELLRNIRENHGSLPVIMMTGYGEKNLVIEALRRHCDGFIEKPFTLEQLIAEIERIELRLAISSLRDESSRAGIVKELDEISFLSYATYIEGKLLAFSLNLKELVDVTTDMFVELMRVDWGCLMLFHENSRELSMQSVKGLKQGSIKRESRTQIEKEVAEWIAGWKKPIQRSDLDEQPSRHLFRMLTEEIGQEIFLSIPLMAKDKFIGLVNLGERESKKGFNQKDLQLLFTMSGPVAMSLQNAELYEGLRRSYLSTVSALAEAIETKDPYTRGHSDRVSRYATAIARAMNLPEAEIEGIQVAGILHDIGKIGVPEGLLLKFAPLTDPEFEVIKGHALTSARIIEKAEFPWDIKSLTRHHHEKYDGSGYPDGLKGADIPLGARILAVADTYEALLADRPYRRGFPKEKGLEIIKEVSGTQLDPEIVPVFLELVEKGVLD